MAATMAPQNIETRTTLFDRLRTCDDQGAWREFESCYGQMLYRFCRSLGLQHADAEDAVQGVMSKIVSGIKNFDYDRKRGRFRDYLFRCARSAISDLKSSQNRAAAAVVSNGKIASDFHWNDWAESQFEREWVHHHYRRAIECLRLVVDTASLSVFDATLRNRSVREISQEMNMSEDAVYKSLQRFRARLREQITRQIQEEDGDE